MRCDKNENVLVIDLVVSNSIVKVKMLSAAQIRHEFCVFLCAKIKVTDIRNIMCSVCTS